MIKFIQIEEDSRIPKYKQIVDSIIHNITVGNLAFNDKIPSINALSEEYYLSRDTVERAYGILKDRKIINSIRGKGYYISADKMDSNLNVLFLINKLSNYKMKMFHSFMDNIGPNCNINLQVYHCDESLFLNVLNKNEFVYDYYVIALHFKTETLQHISYTNEVIKSVKKIPSKKLIILDNKNASFDSNVSQVYQDFENDIYEALQKCLEKIKKYKKLILVFPEKLVYPFPRRILFGFKKFCVEFEVQFEIIDKIYDDMILKVGDLFITIAEPDLVELVKQIRDDEMVLGTDIGVISYNDTPLKDLLGITVISTDFNIMGEMAANMILSKEIGIVKVPFNFIDRESL